MKRVLLLILAAMTILLSPQQLSAQSREVTPAGERTSVDLTIYNQNLSLIREERSFTLARGLSRVVVPDIPSTIDGTSLHFLSLTDPMAVKVLEQNYQYDLVNTGTLLEKYIGKEVEFVRLNEETKQEYTVKGRILSTGWQIQPMYGGRSSGSSYVGGMVAEVAGKIASCEIVSREACL